jgi:polynucleotide 5'-hydroxyl-kinase GRC3/NOL9
MHRSYEDQEPRPECRRRRISIKAGNTLLISGPASFRLVNGRVNVLASPVKKGREISVREGKQLPLESLENSLIDCSISDSARCMEIVGSAFPSSWVEIAETILEVKKAKTVVIGNVDSGKSTFCTILANLALNAGMKITILDADLGQSDIGPPCSIGIGRVQKNVLSLSEVTPDLLYFAGYISPAPITDKVLRGIESLLNCTKNVDTLVINTDGWVIDDQAIIYKKRLIDAVEPDIVVGIGKQNEVSRILELTKQASFQIESPRIILRRTREQRKELREYGYRKYLANGRQVRVNVDRIQLSYSNGTAIKPSDIDTLPVNAIVGMLDDHDWLLGIGVLLQIDLQGKALKVFSPITRGFSKVEIGAVKLDEHGTELSYLE